MTITVKITIPDTTKAHTEISAAIEKGIRWGLDVRNIAAPLDVAVEVTMPKSKAASKVLQLMDDDYTYQHALRIVLSMDESLDKTELEKELNHYI